MLMSLGLKNAVESATIYDTSSMKIIALLIAAQEGEVTVRSFCLERIDGRVTKNRKN